MSEETGWRSPDKIQIAREAYGAIRRNDRLKLTELLEQYRDYFRQPFHQDNERFQLSLLDRLLYDAGRANAKEIIDVLITHGADVNKHERRCEGEGVCLELATTDPEANCAIIKWLVSERRALVAHSREGEPVSDTLIASTIGGASELVRFLVERGTPINGRSQNGLTALDFAIQEGRPEIVDYLRSQGALTAAEVRARKAV